MIPCEPGEERSGIEVTGNGRLQMRVDTLDLFVRDVRIGEQGLVQRGKVLGDSLVFWNSDMDGGDYLYIRRP